MIGATIAGLGGALGKGFMDYKAGKEQMSAADRATALQQQAIRDAGYAQRQAYNQAMGGLGQFILPQYAQAFGLEGATEVGTDPLSQLRAATGVLGKDAQQQYYQGFQEDPSTQYLRDEGVRGINQQLSAQGGLGGGSRLKAITEFSQKLANQQLDKRLSQLGGLAQQDLSMAGGLANLGTGLGDALASNYMQLGQAGAQGQMNRGNIAANQYSNLGNLFSGLGGAAAGFMGGGMGGFGGSPTPTFSTQAPANIANYGSGYYR